MKKLSRVYLHRLLSSEFYTSDNKDSLYLLVQGGYLSLGGRFISCFQGDREKGQSVLLALAVSQVILIQNNQYASDIFWGDKFRSSIIAKETFLLIFKYIFIIASILMDI